MPTVLESLNQALQRAMADHPQVYLLGEDVLDPYGGAFKVARGLSTAFPKRVITTPISEAAIVGLAAGMALRGLRPVVEIMFGDFLALAADQIVNHISKFRWMYNQQVQLPLVIRTPMGGRRGYGPTHSQTLEKLFMGVPGLVVVAPTFLGDPGELLCRMILETVDPVLFVENKLLYLLPVQDETSLAEFELLETNTSSGGTLSTPTYSLALRGAPPAMVTIGAYGYMAELARQAMLKLAYEHEIFAELVVPTRLAPLDIDPLQGSLRHTCRLLVVEEGSLSMGWGAEVIARCTETQAVPLKAVRRLAAANLPVPASTFLEAKALPSVEQIVEKCLEITRDG